PDEHLSLGASIVLIAVYAANLVYTLITRRDVFSQEKERDGDNARGEAWPLWRSIGVLVGATAAIALEAELVSGALESAAGALGVSTFFLGIVPLAIIGNAAEYLAAFSFARQDRMDLVMSITVGSTIQVALFTAPLLVLVSYAMGRPMNLVFRNPLELVAVAASAFTVNSIAQDGETTWFEGVLLIGVYIILALAFLFVTP
ncbi:MAG: calcium/proton exchanger, partial [Gemmatimonadota bacterium]|nr:calcium/proton exchanger [Gemmatimonadota bacterium]